MENDIQSKFDNLEKCLHQEKYTFYIKSRAMSRNIYDMLKDIENCESHIHKLIEMCIVISKHPRRLIKKGTNSQSGTQFETTISCILETDNLFINIKDIKSNLLNMTEREVSQCGEITAKKEETGKQQWTLKNMRFKSSGKKRASKQTISEKSVILFNISWEYQNGKFTKSYTTKLFSETVVVIVHSSQEPEALLTLFVDDYFRIDRRSFIEGRGFPHLDYVNVIDLIHHISDYFKEETGRHLTKDNCEYLLSKALTFFNTDKIQITDFKKTPMPHVKLSFGIWIMLMIKLCKIDHVIDLWQGGYIEGFISKEVGSLLKDNGSFLLRFSEKQAAIGVIMRSGNNINAWRPFTDVECRKMNISNHLYDFPSLITIRKADGTFLSKSIALSNFIENANVDDGYTPRGCVTNQLSVEDENPVNDIGEFDGLFPSLDNMDQNSVNDISLDGDDLVVLDGLFPSLDNMDITDLSDICQNLLND